MLRVDLVALVIVAVVVCYSAPLSAVAVVVTSGLLWRLFVAFRNTSGAMSGVDFGRSGLLDGFTTSPRKSSGPEVRSRIRPSASSRVVVTRPAARGDVEVSRSSSRSGPFDDDWSPFSSPSVSLLSSRRSPYVDNQSYRSDDQMRGTSVPSLGSSMTSLGSSMLPPGSYPWLVPSPSSSIKKRINLESIPVKIKVSKPATSFLSTPDVSDAPQRMDSSKQIIKALKAMSRKRQLNPESDDSHDESFGAAPKRRPSDFHHNLYASHLGSSDSSFQGVSENQDENIFSGEPAAANGCESNTSSNATPNFMNNGPANNQVSNKRPRAANDSGNQTAKKRNQTNNEILSSLSSSLALLDPHIIRKRLVKNRERSSDEPSKRTKTTETHCVEVQTLPSPILKENTAKEKQDKGTDTDRLVELSKSSSDSTQTGVIEKKVTNKMAAALLKSALIKFANSGELVTPDTSANSNSVLSESSLLKNDVGDGADVRTSISLATSEPTSTNVNGTTSVAAQPAKPMFGFTAATSTSVVTASATPITAAILTTATDKPGFTLSTSMAITPSPTEPAAAFSYGAALKTPDAPKPVEAPVSSSGFQFTAVTPPIQQQPPPTIQQPPAIQKQTLPTIPQQQPPSTTQQQLPPSTIQQQLPPSTIQQQLPPSTIQQQPSFTFGASVTTTSSSVTIQKEPPVTSSSEIKPSLFSFGATTTSSSQTGFKLGVTTTPVTPPSSVATSPPKPGGFSFTPSAKFTFGSTPVTSSVSATTTAPATTTTTAPAFNFGGGTFGSKSTESGGKGLFGMPPPPSKPTPAAEPVKTFGGGFSFTSKDQPAFSAAKPEEKKTEGFVFGSGTTQKPESKPFSFGGSSLGDQTKPSAPAFNFGSTPTTQPSFASSSQPVFGAGSGAQPSFSTGTGAPSAFGSFPTKSETPSLFNLPATTSSSPFGSNTTTVAGNNSVITFGSTPKTTAPSFGSSSTAVTTAPLTFGSGLTSIASPTPSFGSGTPAFGSSLNNFGSSGMTFGATSGFGASNPPTFGSVGTPAASTANPAPAFGSGATTAPQFGSSTFGSSSTPSFGGGSAFGVQTPAAQPAPPAFGAPQTSASASAFGAPQTTTQLATPSFGSLSTPAPQAAPTFGALAPASSTTSFGAPASSSSPFSFSASTQQQPAAPSSGFNFQAPGASKPMFQFGASGAPPQPSAPQPFAFSGGAPAPGVAGGFTNTMFSIGSGSASPRSRTTLRTRKK